MQNHSSNIKSIAPLRNIYYVKIYKLKFYYSN